MNLPFHSYRTRLKKGAVSRLLNCYAVQSAPEGRAPTAVMGSAGIDAFSTISTGPQHAAIEFGGTLYCVAGNTFYSVDSNGVETSIGTISGSGSVDIAKNTSQIAILRDTALWVYEGGVLTAVSDADFTSRGGLKMAVLDSYGGFIEPNSGRFFICDLDDFTVYDALDFATAEGNPDNLVSIESNQRQFVLFGKDSIELWDNVGGTGFPFQRSGNGYVENGCIGKDATCMADNTVFWMDTDRMFRKLEGITPRRISNDGCEQQWQDYATVSDAKVFSYIFDGHTFVVVQFPAQGTTWVYDINTQEWHERASYGFDYWRASWVVKVNGATFVGDTETGNIGEMSATSYSEWDNILSREATTGVIYGDNRWMFHGRLELDLEVGQGIESGQGSDPEIMLDLSNDGGRTFISKSSRKLGVAGQFSKRVHWEPLGRSRERVYRFRVTDPVPFSLQAARLDVT